MWLKFEFMAVFVVYIQKQKVISFPKVGYDCSISGLCNACKREKIKKNLFEICGGTRKVIIHQSGVFIIRDLSVFSSSQFSKQPIIFL